MKTLLKTLAVGIALVASFTANAATDQEIGSALAICSGDYAYVGMTQMQNNNSKEGKQYMDISVAFFKAASAKIGKDAADKIGAQEIRKNSARIQANDPKAADEIFARVSKSCPAIGKVGNVGQYL